MPHNTVVLIRFDKPEDGTKCVMHIVTIKECSLKIGLADIHHADCRSKCLNFNDNRPNMYGVFYLLAKQYFMVA